VFGSSVLYKLNCFMLIEIRNSLIFIIIVVIVVEENPRMIDCSNKLKIQIISALMCWWDEIIET
jgi:hypothetical protein